MEVLIKEKDDYIKYFIEFEDWGFETLTKFTVFKDNLSTNPYLKGIIKLDGYSHIWFGDENVCSHTWDKNYFERHKQLMDAIWASCSKQIENWVS
jgi:hypothetical protein